MVIDKCRRTRQRSRSPYRGQKHSRAYVSRRVISGCGSLRKTKGISVSFLGSVIYLPVQKHLNISAHTRQGQWDTGLDPLCSDACRTRIEKLLHVRREHHHHRLPQLYFPSGSLSLSSSRMLTSTLACIVKGLLLLITWEHSDRSNTGPFQHRKTPERHSLVLRRRKSVGAT